MTAGEHEYSADERFERLLIDSAQHDELPNNVDVAWQNFDSALKGVSLLAAGAGGAWAVRRAQRWLAAKWLIWGVLSGSALTAVGLRVSHHRPPQASPTPSAAITVPAAPNSTSTAQVEREAKVQEERTKAPSAVKPTPHSARPHQAPTRSAEPVAPSSTLAAQVALLDSARTAIAAGAFAEALRLADRYRADFPAGELGPEAEVVAIEALVARGDRAAASARAARFLARYPGDPHAARVKWLVR